MFSFIITSYNISYLLIGICLVILAIMARKKYINSKNVFLDKEFSKYFDEELTIKKTFHALFNTEFNLSNMDEIVTLVRDSKLVVQGAEKFCEDSNVTIHNKKYLNEISIYIENCNNILHLYDMVLRNIKDIKSERKMTVIQYFENMESRNNNEQQ